MKSIRLPHPIVLLVAAVLVAAVLTWVLPAGEYARHTDAATGRDIVTAGTYHRVAAAPVLPFAAIVAIPRGFIEAADVVVCVLLAGAAFVMLDQLGVLQRAVGALAARLASRGLIVIPIVTLFFFSMGGLENMQEEIIPLVPVLLALARASRIDAVSAVAMSAGAAMAGSAFSPINPFQAGIALKLAEQAPLSGGALRITMFAAAYVVWAALVMRHAGRHRTEPAPETRGTVPVTMSTTAEVAPPRDLTSRPAASVTEFSGRDALMLACVLVPLLIYVYGALRLDWGFNELSAGFLIGAIAAALVGRVGVSRTTTLLLEGTQALLPAALLIGVARSISVVLADGHVIDTILDALATPLASAPRELAAILMIPFHMIVHVPVPSVSGQAVLTMPLLVPLSDLLGISRQATVLAYQSGAGLMEMLTPTNGALMAVLLTAGVSFQRWLRFVIVLWGAMLAIGIVGVLVAMRMPGGS